MDVYVCFVVLVCVIINFFLILGTNRLTGYAPRIIRSIIASLLGGIYAGGYMVYHNTFLRSGLLALFIMGLMCVIAFGFDRWAWKRSLLYIFLLFATMVVTAAVCTDRIICALFFTVFIWLVGIMDGGCVLSGKLGKTVLIDHNGVKYSFSGYLDTGNKLRDPLSGESVLVMGRKASCLLTGLPGDALEYPADTMLKKKGFRLIPYNTVGRTNGMLLAMRFSNIMIDGIRQSRVIAFAPVELDGYDMLLGG